MTLHDVLTHEVRSEFFLEFPTRLGKLRLDLVDQTSVQAAIQHPKGPEGERLEEAEAAWQKARALYRPGAHEASEKAMVEICRRYPLWGKGHGALYELYVFLKRFEDAEYHLLQLLALQPIDEHLKDLGNLLGRQKKLAEAEVVQRHLFERREKAPTKGEGHLWSMNYLVTLGRLQRTDRMLEVVDQAEKTFGQEAGLEYQAIFALILAGRKPEAKTRFDKVFPTVEKTHPLYRNYLRMKAILGG